MNWIDRKFEFGETSNDYSQTLERLASTPGRLKAIIENASDLSLSFKPNGKWSVKEHMGHLLVMESLWIARLDDLVMKRGTLRAWNGTNADTDEARFNEQHAEKILSEFSGVRTAEVAYMLELGPDCFNLIAWHERLQQQLSVADHGWFVAEHDDHHLRSITSLVSSS